jgi:hypothetical protein
MAENSIIEQENQPQEEPKTQSKKPSQPSLFTQIEGKLSMESLFVPENFTNYLSKFAWLVLLGIIYIYNSHVSERLSRERDMLTKLVEDLRTHYTTLHADVMLESKESEIVKKVQAIGLTDNTAPQKIIIEKVEK